MKHSTMMKQARAVWSTNEYEDIIAVDYDDAMVIGSCSAVISNSWNGFRTPSKLMRHSGFYRNLFDKPPKLFSSIVTLCGDGMALEDFQNKDNVKYKKYKYWFVLTYIPDLQWCRVVPLIEDGVFEEEHRFQGRTIWKLLPESPESGCFEIDVSAFRCKKVSSRAVLNVPDADDERWDIGELTPGMRVTEDIYARKFKKKKKSRSGKRKKKKKEEDVEEEPIEISDDAMEVEDNNDDDEDFRTEDEESSSESSPSSPRQGRRRSHGSVSSHSPRSTRRPRKKVNYCENDDDSDFVLSEEEYSD